MTVTVKHPFVSAVADSTDTSLVRPSNWNADHTVVGLGTAAELNAGVANGVATLDSGGQVPLSQIPPLGDLNYQGTWNASTNSPTLTSSTGTKGYYYVVSVAGSTNLNGITDWKVSDWAVFNGSVWQKIDNTDAVTSVNGYTGAVVLTYTDVGAFPATPTTGANSVVLRDANQNVSANAFFSNSTSVAAAGTTTTLVASSTTNWSVTGSGGQTFQLPDATTLPVGATFTFNNNQTSGTIVVKNNSGTTVVTVQSGGFVTIYLLVNTPAAGSWDTHYEAPSNVSWSTNTFDYAGSITSATWNGTTVQVNRGGTGATTLTGYVKGSGTAALTASTSIPTTDLSGTVTNAQLANSAITINGTSVSLGGSTSVGSVTSVAATVPAFLSITGTPITSSGTLAISYSGTALPIANGGTGLTTTPANGALDIGNGTGFTRTTLTAGSGVSITNAAGAITIAASGATPAGSNTQVQFNNSGAFGAASNFTWNGTALSAPALIGTTSVTTPLLQSSASNLAITASTGIVDASGNTGAITSATGTTAQRPASPVAGQMRWNTTLGVLEVYVGSSVWTTLASSVYTVTYLVVAGGGGGGGYNGGGGGGAGGLLTSTTNLTPSVAYTITVGAGGTAGQNGVQAGAGTNSSFSSIAVATGGGYGCSGGPTTNNGGAGGSGGGGSGNNNGTGGAGTSGQGYAGGTGLNGALGYGAGGGGGASAVGGNYSGTNPSAAGAGGAGVSSSISGSAVTYAGGGGGAYNLGTGAAGGAGGGGVGGGSAAGPAAGTAGLGGGGGGGSTATYPNGAAGGSGIVIISYAGAQRGTGGTVTSSGGNTIHTFTTSGTYTA